MVSSDCASRILVVAPPDFAPGLESCLPEVLAAPDLQWVASASEAKQFLSRETWDCCCLAPQLADGAGLSLLAELRREYRDLRVLALAPVADDPMARRMLQEGADELLVIDRLQPDYLQRVFAGSMEDRLVGQAPVALLTLDDAGNILAAEGGLWRQLGFSAHWLVGQAHDCLAPDFELDPDHLSRALHGEDVCCSLSLRGESYQLIWKPHNSAALLTIVPQVGATELISQRDYLAVTSHDIRTLMGSIIGMTDLLLETDLDAQQNQYVERFRRAGSSMLWLIDNVLELSRMQSGHQQLNQEPFRLRDVLDDLDAIMGYRARQQGLSLRLEVDPRLPERLVGDARRLGQILLNLVSNAIKFTRQGEVALLCAPRPTGVRLQVVDTGPGIPPELLERVFEHYTQAEDSDCSSRGSGLGLAIVHQLVTMMGGTIQAGNTEDGACFVVDLPLVAAPAKPADKLPPRPPPPPPPGAKPLSRQAAPRDQKKAQPAVADESPPQRVLLAEDNADTRILIQHFLAKTPHQLDLAENGEEAVRMVRETSYDLVFMDIQMPVMDGFQATAAIREMEQREGKANVPIVALTAHAMTHDRSRCLEAGCSDYLPKPVRKGQILACIAKHGGSS